MPSTAEFWDVDGVSLHEENQNIRSWGGSREEPPPLRGKNEMIPFSYGDRYVEKTPAARSMILDGWMVDRDSQNLRKRWRAFRSLLWRPHELFSLTRRWLNDEGELMVGTGLAEYVSGLEPIIQAGGTRLEFKVTLEMPDPFFYSERRQINLPTTAPVVAQIAGDYSTNRVQAEFFGAQSGSALTVRKGANVDNVLRYGSMGVGGALVDSQRFRATEVISGSTIPTSHKVGHDGRTQWLYLPVGTTRIDYSRASGVGTAAVRYEPAWI